MELNLLPILNYDGKKMEVDQQVAVNADKGDTFTIASPVKFTGYAQNVGGTIELKGKGQVALKMTCDRCMDEYDKVLDFEIDESYRKQDQLSSVDENPDIIPLSGTALDLEELLYTNMFMNIPSKSLCSEDCKGLCPVCGANLNRVQCDCTDDNTDPRFDILDKLL